ncbi:secondary thiamine-phosphate synthase enzyme YjbQ [soil metagenome]
METKIVEYRTGSEPAVIDLSDAVVAFCRDKGDGLLNVFAAHATAGVAVIEIGSGTEEDLLATLQQLLPRSYSWRHQHGAIGHGGDHVLPALVSPSLTIPVVGGRPALGTWQSVVLVDPNRDNPVRQIRLSFVGG